MKSVIDILKKNVRAKQDRRNALSRLPIEQKVQILLELQKMACPVLSQRGLHRRPWKIK